MLGAGWQSIREQQVYAAVPRRRAPPLPGRAASRRSRAPTDRQYGIDNAYIQVARRARASSGSCSSSALLGTGLVLGASRALRAPPFRALQALVGLLWLLVAMGTWAAQGLVAGSAFAALSWFALGLVAAAGSPADA